MKRILCFLICLFVVGALVGCTSGNKTPVLRSGTYEAVGDYEEMLTPALSLDTEKKEFWLSFGAVVSYAEYGTYEVSDGVMVATSQAATYRFEIKDDKTLVLNGGFSYAFSSDDPSRLPDSTKFVLKEALK